MDDANRKLFTECLVRMLRPVVKFCLRSSIRIGDLMECAKQAFLVLAEEELAKKNVQASHSRLSVMTGIHRRDVARIVRDKEDKAGPINFLFRVIGQWQTDKRFVTKGGSPQVLTLGKSGTFDDLVRAVSNDLNPYTVLYELERTGAIERTAGGVKLRKATYLPRGDLKEISRMMAHNTADLMDTIECNMCLGENETPDLHLVTEYDNVVTEAIPHIKQWLLREGSRFHKRVRNFVSHYDCDVNPAHKGKKAGARVVLAGFSKAVT